MGGDEGEGGRVWRKRGGEENGQTNSSSENSEDKDSSTFKRSSMPNASSMYKTVSPKKLGSGVKMD
jgi:hypothetical protein